MPRKILRSKLNLETLRERIESWYVVKQQATALQRIVNTDKDDFKALVQQYGQKDPEKGHIFLELDGVVGEKKIATLKNQRSVSPSVNQDAAERILKRKGLWDQLTVIVRVLDQEKIYAAFYDGKITQGDLDQIFTESISYSLILLDDNNKPVS